MTSQQFPDNDPPIDPALELVAAAIMDGTPVDWTALSASGAAAEFGRELRVVADVAALHRSLADDESEPLRFPPSLPWQVGTLTLTASLGRGTYGEVFRAWDSQLHRDVALKLLFVGPQRGDTASRALAEGRLLARVRHPNVVTVHAVEQIEDRIGLVTEYLEGRTLAQRLRESGPLSAAETRGIGRNLSEALAAVHAAGLLHRDIKAQNVMHERGGRIVLMDFGTGHELETVTGPASGLAGTPLYLAPELFHGASASVASDLYALAVLLFHLLTGQYPVDGRTLDEVRSAHERGVVRRVRDVRPDAPAALAAAVDRGLAANPRDRYATATDFAEALTQADPDRQPAARVSMRSTIAMTAAAAVIASVSIILTLRSAPGAPASAAPATPVGIAQSTTYRKLNPPFSDAPGRPSRDGRYLPYVDFPAGNLWYWEIASGVSRQITRKPADSPEVAGWSAMSPDGSHVAYTWWTSEGAYDLRVISIDNGEMRSILASGTAEYAFPLEWSADGSQILSWLEHEDGRVDLALVPAAGGSARVVETFRRGRPRHASLSPDGRFVVYDFPRDFRSMRSDVMILATDGSPARTLIGGSANNMNPFWTPDGSRVFFTSDRSGSIDGWVVNVNNGRVIGEPTLAARNLGLVRPIALTGDGVYHYGLDTSEIEVYTLPVDLSNDAPRVTGTPSRVSPAVIGGHVGPHWSPDGRSLAFITRVPSTGTTLTRGANKITIMDVSSGRQRDVVPQLAELQIASPQWSPDSRSLAVRGRSLENRLGYFRIDARTGQATPLVLLNSPKNESDYGVFAWFRAGKAFVYRHAPRGMVARDLTTGLENVVVDWKAQGLSGFHGLAVSPDGSSLAFAAMSVKDGVPGRAVFVQSGDGPPRELFRVSRQEFAVVQAWMPDGQAVLFTRYRQGQNAAVDPHHLWMVSVRDGAARDTTVRIPGFTQPYWVALSPDGRRIAYTAGMTSAELWMMENFLPPGR